MRVQSFDLPKDIIVYNEGNAPVRYRKEVVKMFVNVNPKVQVLIGAFVAAAVPVLLPVLENGDFNFDVVKVAIAAGVGAVLRTAVLFFPSSK